MQLIHDNQLIGLKFKDKPVVWCDTLHEASMIAFHHFRHMPGSMSLMETYRDMAYAVDYMTKHNHTISEFGIFGGFMYSKEG